MSGFLGNIGDSANKKAAGQLGGAFEGLLGFGGGAISGLLGGMLGGGIGGNSAASTKAMTDLTLSATLLKEAASGLREAAQLLSSGGAPQAQTAQGPLMHQVGKSAVNPATGLPYTNMGVMQQPAAAGAEGGMAGGGAVAGGVIAAAMMLKQVSDKVFEGFHNIVDVAPQVTESFAGMIGLPKTFASLLGSATDVIAAPAHMAAEALHQFISPIEFIKDPLRVFKIGLTSVTDAGTAMARTLWELRDPAALLSQSIAPFAAQISKFNPGIMERLNLALDGLSAAAGRLFVPIVEPLTAFANELNAAYTSMEPVRGLMGDLASMGIGAGREIFASLFAIVGEGVPVVRGLISDLQPFAPTARLIMAALTDAATGAIRFGGEMLHGAMEFLQPLTPLVGVVLELGRAFGALWDAGVSLFRAFNPLFPQATSLVSVIGVVVGALQYLAAGASTTATIMAQTSAEVLRIARNPSQAGTFGAGISNPRVLFQEAMARMQQQGPGAAVLPGSDRTAPAQQARHVGIEDIGLEARRAAFSQGQDVQQQQLTELQTNNRTLLEFMNWARQMFPGAVGALPVPQM